jgi:ABC-type branched-subunit amino acid transport system substrate-binding protein
VIRIRSTTAAVPIGTSLVLLLAACGGSGDAAPVAQAPAAVVQEPGAGVKDGAAADSTAALVSAVADFLDAQAARKAESAKAAELADLKKAVKDAKQALTAKDAEATQAAATAAAGRAAAAKELKAAGIRRIDSAPAQATNESIYAEKNGATDVGVTKAGIRMGAVSMYGMALGNVLIEPMGKAVKATLNSINDRGGVLGRRMSLVECDDGAGEVARSKACLKKLVGQDKIFGLLGYTSWASASIHDDLRQYRLPAVGTWAYSQTEWQDPYMFPTHMSMIHEAMAGANWVRDVIKPRTYGLICLTSPEMQLACDQVEKVLNASGSKLVKRADIGITEASMSPHVLSMRAAAPDHVLHYVINPATMAKFMIETAQQGYYPPKGISGNHLAAEVLGSLFGRWPEDRYWTNTTYKMWGAEFMATMSKYARGNEGLNHHVVQATYTGVHFFADAAKAVGPNLTRERLMTQLSNGDVYRADASLDQKFSWTDAERYGDNWNAEMGQGREFMYKYTSVNTVGRPNGSPSGFVPDPTRFVIHARD